MILGLEYALGNCVILECFWGHGLMCGIVKGGVDCGLGGCCLG